ncbi:uncharacterized protein LOC129586069 [Paramacrobiotus metropolitanus]|uniref:uncharacterized protein LOC129586069 n=1 Tax=Paramacrobiotus metropolitanus TaxID=2943436 RepID=UPI0024463F04|nr:uncharacterized protein LOC129586069 [Paramacrobiotus metropolitanus]
MRLMLCALLAAVLLILPHPMASLPLSRQVRDVVDTVKNVYQTVAKGTKAVFHDMIGNSHVAAESYRQAADASQRVAPSFQDIFVNQHKTPIPVLPPTQPTPAWEAH